jgi:N-acetylmuramoyl-L-alanine amidase
MLLPPAPPNPYDSLELSDSDIQLIARVVYAESCGECYNGQMAVAEVVLNRMLATGDTAKEVVYSPHQFSVGNTYTEKCIKAVCDALNWQGSLKNVDVLYFARGKFEWAETYMVIGNHIFRVFNL